jgi:hypothetical protein
MINLQSSSIMNRRFILFLLSFSIGVQAYSQQVSATLTPNQAWIGDHLDLELRYKNRGLTNTLFPLINDTSMGNFRFVERVKIDTMYSGTEIVISHKYKITCFEDSIQTLPPLPFFNGALEPLYTQPIKVNIVSPNIDSAKDIRKIKDIMLLPLSKDEIFSYLFISFILLGIVLFMYFIYIKYIRKETLFDREKPEDLPHVVALQGLKVVENENLWQMGKVKEYYDRISDILRIYIEKRFGLKAMEQTTAQLLNSMHEIQLPDYVIHDMEQILSKSDLAKFAKEKHEGELHMSIMKMAYKFVQSTQISNDVNKKTNALQVRKFYSQNKYGYKSVAINQYSFRGMIYGLIATLVALSISIILAYSIPIQYILGLLANSTYMYFIWFLILGIILTLINLYSVRSKLLAFWLIFDYNSIIIKRRSNQKSVLYKNITNTSIDKKGNLVIEDNAHNTYTIPKDIEYFQEVRERIIDVAGMDQ